jgi:chromosomal replication initiator protein
VVAFASLTGRSLSVDLAQDVLKDVFPQGEGAQISIERIQELVCDRFSVTMAELTGDRRSQNIVYPRQVAMYLARELTDQTLPAIGRAFGNRDHTTVMHACKRTAERMAQDPEANQMVRDLTERLRSRS